MLRATGHARMVTCAHVMAPFFIVLMLRSRSPYFARAGIKGDHNMGALFPARAKEKGEHNMGAGTE